VKLRVGNACWHAFHIQHAFLCHEAGFFAQEGIDAEIVHAKINPKGIDASRPDGERYDEVGTVLRDMVAFGIDIIPDVHVRTPFAERALGNDEVLIIGGWRNQFRGTLVGAPGIKSFADLRSKRVGDWYKGGIATLWYEHQLRQVGIDPDREIQWKIGYKFGSMREAYKPLLAGETDAAIVQNPYVPMLIERGFNKIFDFVEDSKPHGRPRPRHGRAPELRRAQSRADQALLESVDPRLSFHPHRAGELSVFALCRGQAAAYQSG
jgi:ABC-type amino acid transport substrate-binding protein